MHGAWGALTILTRKQNNAKYRKAELRHELQKKKEQFLKDHPTDLKTELEFPEVSKQQLELIKKEIRRKAKREFYLNIAAYIITFAALVSLFLYWKYS